MQGVDFAPILTTAVSQEFLQNLFDEWQRDPFSVDSSWRTFFQALDGSTVAALTSSTADVSVATLQKSLQVFRLIDAYRKYGHLFANINPIAVTGKSIPVQLSLDYFSLSNDDLDDTFPTFGLLSHPKAPLRAIFDTLKTVYCGTVGIEYMGLQNLAMVTWLQKKIEPHGLNSNLAIAKKKMILRSLNRSELLESFIHTKYTGQKRFSLEGGETLIPMLEAVIDTGAIEGVTEVVIGMAHRGRLNVLSNILDKSYATVFGEFEERYIPNSFEGSGDVKYHKGFSSWITTSQGNKVRLELSPNPSHLEAVDPVVEGLVRSRQESYGDKSKVLPILVHGDAAVAGQGIIYETMQMNALEGYSTGGTIHFVINNQIGFTTNPTEGRSTHYCTDIARAFDAPVFHVNAEHAEGCVQAALLALQLRNLYGCDVFIDLNCWRKYGHNESDEPAYTQPMEYGIIRGKKTIREIYRDQLIQEGIVERKVAEELERQFHDDLQRSLQDAKQKDDKENSDKNSNTVETDKQWDPFQRVDTAVDAKELLSLSEKAFAIPSNFYAHPKLAKLFEERSQIVKKGKAIDWGCGEILAYASILIQGVKVRLAGQDCRRGTFSHRHVVLVDQKHEEEIVYAPLNHLRQGQGHFEAVNSLLSEYAALGFEYGYSLPEVPALVLWEAQFGDFSNGAQVVFDQFISTAEQKWGQKSSIVLLLPHGYEGQGPEHSSARIERFLTLSGQDNWYIVQPTTPAQLFHLLRRQVMSKMRKPLIVFTPKGLLRAPACTSPIEAFSNGTFEEIIDDDKGGEVDGVTKLWLCSGRIFYELNDLRTKKEGDDVAIVRIEQFYPFHVEKLHAIVKRYKNLKRCFWAQDEPENMGAWHFLRPHIEALLPKNCPLLYAGRDRSASPAVGSYALHKKQQAHIHNTLTDPDSS